MTKKLSFILLVYVVSLLSCLWAMGEQPIRANNLATKSALLNSDKKQEQQKLIDGDVNTGAVFSSVFLDLGSLQYLDKIEVFESKNLDGIKLSEDIVNWSQLITPSATLADRYIFDLKGQEGRYVRVLNSKDTLCKEIAIYPFPDYVLQFQDIQATPDTTSCTIYLKTNVAVLTNTIYGFNYDFIYNKKLEFAISSLTPGKENIIKINDLKPDTTYRYQIIVTDFNKRTLSSNYFTFTTKSLTENKAQ